MKKGFTLVELMVVIAIIGILTAMVLPNVNNFTMKARDARRKSDLNAIQMALESYFEDNNFYPPSACGWDCGNWRYSTSGPQWIPEIATYLRGGAVPRDPINNAAGPWTDGYYSYAYGCVGRTTYSASYDLNGQLENTQDPDRCAVQCYKYYFSNNQWCTACGGPYSNQLYEIGPLTR